MWTEVSSPLEPDRPARYDLDECAGLIRAGSRSFHAASLLLPRDVRQAALALYAFCRVADDRVDEGADPHAALVALRRRLGAAYASRPENSPVDRSFAWVVSRYAIPRAVPEALLEGFLWDAQGRRYESFADLLAYAVRVAGTVGVMMALVMGERRPAALARAVDLGIAMQLTNIARDVGQDAASGRCYLPADWMQEAGVSMDMLLSRGTPDPRVCGLVRRLVEAAGTYYSAGLAGTSYLRPDCRAAIRAAGLIYRDIGRSIAANGYDSVRTRAFVSPGRKLQLGLSALVLRPSLPGALPGEPAGLELVRSVTGTRIAGDSLAEDRLEGWPWVMQLFLSLPGRQEATPAGESFGRRA